MYGPRSCFMFDACNALHCAHYSYSFPPCPTARWLVLSCLRVYVSLVQQLACFYEVHLALRGGHRGRQDEAIQAPRISERHHAVLRPTPTVRHLFLVKLVAIITQNYKIRSRHGRSCVPAQHANGTHSTSSSEGRDTSY